MKKGGGKYDKTIHADKIDNTGKTRRYKALEEGPCIFPFKYNNKTYEECANSKNGKWCPTKLKNDNSMRAEKWGYCESHLKKPEESISEEKEEKEEFEVHAIEYGNNRYLLDKNTRNVYSYPDKNENYIFIGKALPNGEIDFDSPEYLPIEENIKQEEFSSTSISSNKEK